MAFEFRKEPLRSVQYLREAMDHFIREFVMRSASEGRSNAFPIDVAELDAGYVLYASLPGVQPEDLRIEALGNTISISGTHALAETQPGQQWIIREHQSGAFARDITLPAAVNADEAHASFAHGLLTLTLPKADAPLRKQIQLGEQPQAASDDSQSDQDVAVLVADDMLIEVAPELEGEAAAMPVLIAEPETPEEASETLAASPTEDMADGITAVSAALEGEAGAQDELADDGLGEEILASAEAPAIEAAGEDVADAAISDEPVLDEPELAAQDEEIAGEPEIVAEEVAAAGDSEPDMLTETLAADDAIESPLAGEPMAEAEGVADLDMLASDDMVAVSADEETPAAAEAPSEEISGEAEAIVAEAEPEAEAEAEPEAETEAEAETLSAEDPAGEELATEEAVLAGETLAEVSEETTTIALEETAPDAITAEVIETEEIQADAEESLTEEAPVAESVAEETAAAEFTAEEPISEEIVAEESTTEEITAEETLADEPISEEIVAEEVAAEEITAEEPISEEIVAHDNGFAADAAELDLQADVVAEEFQPDSNEQELIIMASHDDLIEAEEEITAEAEVKQALD